MLNVLPIRPSPLTYTLLFTKLIL